MTVVAAAIIGTGLISAYSINRASSTQADALREGMSAEERIADRNLEFQREMADQQRADFAPWRDVGKLALDQIWAGVQSGAFEVGNINLEDDPGYRVRMAEGVKALDASASRRGRVMSGAQNKAILRYGQEQGSKEYAAAYARKSNEIGRRFNILSGLSQGGQASAAGQAQASSQLAITSGNILSNLGRAKNVTSQNIGNVRAGAYRDYAQITNQAAQNWLTYRGANSGLRE